MAPTVFRISAVLLFAWAWGCRPGEEGSALDAGTGAEAGADSDADADTDSDSDSDSDADAGEDAAPVENECFGSDFEISSNADVDFLAPYPCIEGSLTVSGLDAEALSLPNLAQISGDFIVMGNGSLKNLEGMKALDFVGGDLKIMENPAMTSVGGLEGLSSVARALIIAYNESLESVAALGNVTTFDAESLDYCYCWLAIGGNPALSSLTGLEGLDSFCGALELWDNWSLESLAPLGGLEAVELERLFLQGNNTLTDLAGLEGVISVSLITVSHSESLETMYGLGNLGEVWKMIITDNGSLENLDGLSSLKAVEWRLDIEGNPSLPTCEAWEILDALEILPYEICIQENLEDTCNDETWNCQEE